jgi:hypothetical protein
MTSPRAEISEVNQMFPERLIEDDSLTVTGVTLPVAGSPLNISERCVAREMFEANGYRINVCGSALGLDSKKSVLNEHNQSWDMPNLFVTDAICFASSGSVGRVPSTFPIFSISPAWTCWFSDLPMEVAPCVSSATGRRTVSHSA